MTSPPDYEKTRREDFQRELDARAKVWLPEWQPRNRGTDLAGAVFGITARLAGEVAQRLDRIPEKNFRGLLHWLGIRGEAGRAARVPVVFQMTAGASAVRAERGVQVQAAGLDEPVVFETTEAMTVTPAVVTALYAADPSVDAYFSAPRGMLGLDLPPEQQNRWVVLADAPANSRKLQLDPPGGLAPGLVLETEGSDKRQFTVLSVTDGVCDIEPAVGDTRDAATGGLTTTLPGLPARTTMRRVSEFAPFSGAARDKQQHAVYIGAKSALDVEAEAAITLDGWETLDTGYQWSFWGKLNDNDKPGWVDLDWGETQSKKKVLRKPKGKVEETEVNRIKSRWLRGRRKSLLGEREPLALVPLRLFINCDPKENSLPVNIEGVANATPLVLNTGFYPMGREPRLFDAFYLGSKEAFSKPLARVSAHFTFGDDWSSPPVVTTNTAALAPNPRHALFAIGTDQALRVVEITEIGGDSTVTFHAPPLPPDGNGHFLKLQAGARPGLCHQGITTSVSAFAGKEVWLWSSADAGFPGGSWQSLGSPANPTLADGDQFETLLTRNGGDNALYVYALVQGELFRRESGAGSAWQAQPVQISGVPIKLAKIVPLVDMDAATGAPRDQDGLLGLDVDGRLYTRNGFNTWTHVTPPGYRADPGFYPSYIEMPGSASRRVTFAMRTQTTNGDLHLLVHFDPAVGAASVEESEDLQIEGTALDVFVRGTGVIVALTMSEAGITRPAQWDPASSVNTRVVPIPLPLASGELTQAPAMTSARMMVPGARGSLRVIGFNASAHADDPAATVLSAALLTSSQNLDATKKYRVDTTPSAAGTKKVAVVVKEVPLEDSRFALILDDADVTTRDPAAVTLYEDLISPLINSSFDNQNRLVRDGGDGFTDVGVPVFMSWEIGGVAHETVLPVLSKSGDRMVFSLSLPSSATNVKYTPLLKVADLVATLRPAVDVDKKFGTSNAAFTFPDLDPVQQRALVSSPDQGANRWVVLTESWTTAPTGPTSMSADALSVSFTSGEPPRGNNPLLSWEYWDGSSWWRIPELTDSTDSFVKSGDVEFCVPPNIAETEVAGRKNFWIRARLVGGDYGQESVKLETVQTSPLVQKVTRSTENIRAPFINEALVTYKLCCPVLPDHVLAEDGGNFVNHSAANAEPDARVRAFVPLYSGGTERALYVGFDAPPGAQSMSLLFVLDEAPHTDAFPLRAEMRRANAFEPIDCQDGTRGLSETGIVKLQFEAPPLKVGLFGESQHWIRLLPRAGFDPEKWRPSVRGVYANAAMAEAHETQRNETLGSSDGRPGLRVTLARTPVVEGTLKVRVRERLSEEDVAAMRKGGADLVLDTLAGREGPWVLWKEVPDLLSSKPGERVYSFEDDTGDITFGDGLRGLIPPVGRDCIVAETYQRGGGETANQVTRRISASLITPLQGVERAAFLGDASGGSKPADSERTLQFAPDRLGRRRRLLTLADLERAALEFSVDVAQAFARRTTSGIELFMVMRGAQPMPSADQRRGLARFLASQLPPDLAAAGAITIRQPEDVRIKVLIKLQVADLGDADQVREACENRINELLDPKSGGFDGQGWKLGAVPGSTDIAARIEDVPHLALLVSVQVTPDRASAASLVRLEADGLRIEIDPLPGVAA